MIDPRQKSQRVEPMSPEYAILQRVAEILTELKVRFASASGMIEDFADQLNRVSRKVSIRARDI